MLPTVQSSAHVEVNEAPHFSSSLQAPQSSWIHWGVVKPLDYTPSNIIIGRNFKLSQLLLCHLWQLCCFVHVPGQLEFLYQGIPYREYGLESFSHSLWSLMQRTVEQGLHKVLDAVGSFLHAVAVRILELLAETLRLVISTGNANSRGSTPLVLLPLNPAILLYFCMNFLDYMYKSAGWYVINYHCAKFGAFTQNPQL